MTKKAPRLHLVCTSLTSGAETAAAEEAGGEAAAAQRQPPGDRPQGRVRPGREPDGVCHPHCPPPPPLHHQVHLVKHTRATKNHLQLKHGILNYIHTEHTV